MAITVSDNMNGVATTTLAGRTPSTAGSAWVRDGGGIMQLDATAGTYARMSSGNYAVYSVGGTQPIADYEVQATYKRPGGDFGDTFALKARAASASSFYALVMNSAVWRIVLVTVAGGAGGWTSLGSYSASLVNGDVAKLVVQGTTLTFYLNTVQRIQVTDATLSAAGTAGVYWNAVADDTGVGFDDFSVNTLPAAGGGGQQNVLLLGVG